jgi:uncharacterized protein YcbK (DUF882 family)
MRTKAQTVRQPMNRRDFLTASAALRVALLTPSLSHAFVAQSGHRTLWLRRPDRRESFRETYSVSGELSTESYLRLCYVLRDADEGRTKLINPSLLDLLYVMQRYASQLTGTLAPIDILSGYRTHDHNSHLEGAAFNSLHLYGDAADIRVPGMTPGAVAQLALNLGIGGVGQYNTFTHVDVGSVRTWSGSPGAAFRQ